MQKIFKIYQKTWPKLMDKISKKMIKIDSRKCESKSPKNTQNRYKNMCTKRAEYS